MSEARVSTITQWRPNIARSRRRRVLPPAETHQGTVVAVPKGCPMAHRSDWAGV
jgi:hypothetical protein